MKKRGTTLFEVMTTSLLLMAIMAAVVGLFQSYSSGSRQANQQEADMDALLALEGVRNEVRQACNLTAPAVGVSGASTLVFQRIDPGYSGRLPAIQPDPVGPQPVPATFNPLDPSFLAQVSYSMAGNPLLLQRTSINSAGLTAQVPLTGPSLTGFSVDHPSLGSLTLHVALTYQGQQITQAIPVMVDCEL